MIRALKYPGTEMERRIIVPIHRWPFITDNIALRRTPDSLLFALKSLFPRCTLRFSYFHSSKCFTGDLSLSLFFSLRRLTRLQTYCIISSKTHSTPFSLSISTQPLCPLKLLQYMQFTTIFPFSRPLCP